MDPAALDAWAGPQLPGDGPLVAERLGDAGHSNLTYVVRRGDLEWILRRPPRGPLLPTAHDVIREYRVLDLLGRSGLPVRVPRVDLACEDVGVIGAPFYLMERVAGDVVRATLPAWADEPTRHAIGLELVDALAELHAVPVEPFVEAGIGKPGGYLERQLRRWRGQREGAKVRELPDYDAVSEWLGDNLPTEGGTAIVHGDYKLDNVVLQRGPRLVSILDWEMATVGDPLADLGYLLSLWVEPGEDVGFLASAGVVSAHPGFPRRSELVARYEERTGRSMANMAFYTTLATWKLAILLEASYGRHLAGTTDDPFFAMLAEGVPQILARARGLAGA
jgi:aminoglycoside phosphotransferase (APT) family kinase protein